MTHPGRPSMRVQRDAALIQLGLDPATAELDHDPALSRRERTPDGGYNPDANDPHFLKWLAPDAHARKTFGPGGEKRITTRGSDIGEAAKTKRLTAKQAAFRDAVLARPPGEKRKPQGTIASRGFDKAKGRKFNGQVVERT